MKDPSLNFSKKSFNYDENRLETKKDVVLEWDGNEAAKKLFIENLAPIVLFTYNRLDHTSQTMSALQNNMYAKDSRLYIYADAAKNDSSRQGVDEVRRFLHTIDGFRSVEIIERKENLGLARNIIGGVTDIVNEYGKVIVLEDDIVTSKYFLKYMNDALEFYKDESSVMAVSGYFYPIGTIIEADTFFLRLPLPWGWATWKDAWKVFERNPEEAIKKFDKESIKEFNFNNSYKFWQQVEFNRRGKLFTWYVFWYVTVFLNKGLVLYPKTSLVKNAGFDDSGEHCGTTNVFDTVLGDEKIGFANIGLTENVEVRKSVEKYFKSIRPPFFSRLRGYLIRIAQNFFKRFTTF